MIRAMKMAVNFDEQSIYKLLEAVQEKISCAREYSRPSRRIWQNARDSKCPEHR